MDLYFNINKSAVIMYSKFSDPNDYHIGLNNSDKICFIYQRVRYYF